MFIRKTTITAGCVAATLFATASFAETKSVNERFSFVAANADKAGPSGEGRLEIVINRWADTAERDGLLKLVSEGGTDKLQTALGANWDAGYIQFPGNLRYTLRYAHRFSRPDGGDDIVLATDHPVWLWWDASFPRSNDQSFSVIQLRLSKDGTGEGRVSLTNKIGANKEAQTIVLEDYSSQPAVLTDVRRQTDRSTN